MSANQDLQGLYQKLNDQQKQIVDDVGRGIAVIAGAGTGKTTTLVAKCEKLIRDNPQAHFVAVSFTEKSQQDLEEKCSAMTLRVQGEALGRHWVLTIHGLCQRIIREFPTEAGIQGHEKVMDASQAQRLWTRAYEQFWLSQEPVTIQSQSQHQPQSVTIDELLRRCLEVYSLRELEKIIYQMKELRILDHSFSGVDSLENDLMSLTQKVIQHYDRLKSEEGCLDFNDLETAALKALQYDYVCKTYHQEFDLVLVDEFQDTQAIQAKIITAFARPQYQNLCIVGDPKQSIYRFRQANVEVFMDFCSKMQACYVLTKNYRSQPDLIHAINQVCRPLFEHSQLTYHPLEPGLPATDNAPSDLPAFFELQLNSPEDLAQYLYQKKSEGKKLSDFTIVVRKVRGQTRWIRALKNQGISLSIESGGFFWEDPRVRELVALLKWWQQPLRTLDAITFLRAPWVCVEDTTIDEWARASALDRFFVSDHRLVQLWKEHELIASQSSEGQVPVALPIRPGQILEALLEDEQTVEECGVVLLSLWHRVEEASLQGQRFFDIVQQLSHAIDQQQRDRLPPPAVLGEDGVRMMTVHGSKGLEFENVILLDYHDRPERASSMPTVLMDDEEGILCLRRDSKNKRETDSVSERWMTRERQRQLDEEKRIFYVALTRAKQSVIWVSDESRRSPEPLGVDSAQKKEKKQISVYEQLFWRGWLEASKLPLKIQKVETRIETGVDTGIKKISSGTTPSSGMTRVPPTNHRGLGDRYRARHSVSEWLILSRCEQAYVYQLNATLASEVPNQQNDQQDDQLTEVIAQTSLSSVKKMELGTRVHRALELNDLSLLQAIHDEGLLDTRALQEWASHDPWFLNAERTWNECAFEVRLVTGEILVGAVDRLMFAPSLSPSRPYQIFDFKVSQKESDVLTQQKLLDRYQLQLQLYELALQRVEPSLKGKMQSALIQINSQGVLKVEVPSSEVSLLDDFAIQAHDLIAGKKLPKTNVAQHCRYCSYRSICRDYEKAKISHDKSLT